MNADRSEDPATRRMDAVQLAAWREELLAATGRAAERMLNGRLDAAAVRAALGILGEAARVSRVYIFTLQSAPGGSVLCSQAYEWCADGIAPQIDNPDLQNLPMREAGFGRWLDTLGRDEPIYGAVAGLPESERAVLEAQQILSIAVMPVQRHGELWGFIGFDDCDHAQKWTADTISCLQVAARVLSSALERQHYERRSESVEAEYRQLVDGLDSVVFRVAPDGTWAFLSPAWAGQLGWEVAASIGRPAADFVHPEDRSRLTDGWNAMLAAAPAFRGELRFQKPDGSVRWMLVNARRTHPREDAATLVTGTLTDITAAKATEAELIAARHAAEAANRAKSDFLSTMSHELRTPLNAVIGLSESLLELGPSLDVERTRRYLGIIHGSGRQLLAQINDILELARIEAGRTQLNPAVFDLGAMLAAAGNAVQREARAKSIEIAVHRPDVPLVVNADERILRQILQNLVSNALKFTPAKGRIEIGVTVPEDRTVMVTVKDSGIGIPEDKRHLLFKPFSQIESALDRRFGGTGLGLSLVERLTRLHGGSVAVESTVGVGSTFTVTLPGSVLPPPPPAAPVRGSQILLVDDDATQHTLVGDFLERQGFAIVHCYGGEAALAAVRQAEPRLAIVDLNMPGMHGLELIRRLRASPAAAQVPILALTALAEAEDAERSRAAGANVHLPKPVSLAALSHCVRQLVAPTA